MTSFEGKRVAVLGLAVNHRDVLAFLADRGARVEIFDEKPEHEFDAEFVRKWKEKGVIFHFETLSFSDRFDIAIHTPGIRPDIEPLSEAKRKGTIVTSTVNIFLDLCPCPVVGITGTKGKGTTATLLYEMLRRDKKDVHLGGNMGIPILSLLEKLTPDSWVILELSSFQLIDAARSPHIAVVLMVTSDHLDFHENEEEYVAAKANIVRFQSGDDLCVANADYDRSREIGEKAPSKKYWISTREVLEGHGCFIDDGAVVVVDGNKKQEIIETAEVTLPGRHNLENVCAAAMAAHLAGVSPGAIASAIREFKGLPHHLEFVGEANGVKYYDDSVSTAPESAIAAVQSFRSPKVLILGGSGKGADFSELGRAVANDRSVKAVIGIGDEWPRIKEAIEREAVEKGSAPPAFEEECHSMKKVVRAAAFLAAPGDVVLLSPACASFDMFRDYKDRGEQFAMAVRNKGI